MDLDNQDRLRQGLRELADQPVPPGLADRALAGSASLRRRRRVLTGVGALGVLGLAGVVAAAVMPQRGVDVAGPSGSTPTPLVCQVATDEPVPPAGAWGDLPAVARIVLDLLPPRDDYYIGYAFTACERGGQWVYPDGSPLEAAEEVARVQLRVGAAGGTLDVEIYRSIYIDVPTCASLPPTPPGEEMLFCEDPTDGRPLLAGSTARGETAVVAIYADGRGIVVENDIPFLDIDLMCTIATDPDLIALAR